MSKPYAWRLLACLPILKGTACTNTSKEWQTQRRLALYHSALAPIIDEVNEICSKNAYYRFADKLVRQGRWFWHLLSMDGAEHCHKELSLVFFSTFEPINITPHSVMQRNGVPMLYDTASSSNLPSLYICPVSNVLGRVPLIPCFIAGNKHPTLPHSNVAGQREVMITMLVGAASERGLVMKSTEK